MITWLGPTLLRLDLGKAGLPNHAFVALDTICTALKNSEEYTRLNGIDVGRFVMLTVASPHHYYQITNTPPTFQAYKLRHPKVDHEVHVANSLVAYGDRRILGSAAKEAKDISWIAEESSITLGRRPRIVAKISMILRPMVR